MHILGIDHVAISVKDLNRSLEFYTKTFGLKITEREYSKPGVEYFLDCGSGLLGLIQGNESEDVQISMGQSPFILLRAIWFRNK